MYNFNNGYMAGGSNLYGAPTFANNSFGSTNYPTTTPYQPGYSQNNQAAQMNLPIIYTNMIQVEDEKAMDNFPVGVGEIVCLITKDESVICFRKGLPDRNIETTKYRKETPEPAKPVEYVTKDEFMKAVNSWRDSLNELKTKNNPGKGKTGGNS